MSRSAASPGLARLATCVDYSWLKQLLPDPATARHAPNKQSREVSAGHYVELLPDPLPAPALVVHSSYSAWVDVCVVTPSTCEKSYPTS